MKKQVYIDNPSYVDIENIAGYKFYGVESSDNPKGFINKSKYDSGYYRISFINELTNGNSETGDEARNITDLTQFMRNVIEERKKTIYQFDTAKELFDWLVS